MNVKDNGTATIEVDADVMKVLVRRSDVKIVRASVLSSREITCLVSSPLLPPGYHGCMRVSSIHDEVMAFEPGES